jgi:hypothetical protein
LSEEEQRQRVRELVRKQTGMDWPELQVGEIEKAMSSVTLFYWGSRVYWRIDRTVRRPNRDMERVATLLVMALLPSRKLHKHPTCG